MNVIPAIDIIDGKCVRLSQGDFKRFKFYDESPLEMACKFEAAGIKYLHLVDLDGARSNRIVNYKVLESIVRNTGLEVDFGGGIKTNEDIQRAFDGGATQVSIGSVAVNNEKLFLSWLKKYGASRINLGADCRDRKILSNGWVEKSRWDILTFIDYYETNGVQNVICTDVSKDGMLSGPALSLYNDILENTSISLIASGGIRNLFDLEELKRIGCNGAVVGKAILEGKIALNELSKLC